MAPVSINVRPSTGQVFKVQVDVESTTVFGLKEIIAASMGDVSPNDLKLVFSGRILKNQDNCSDYSNANKHIIFLYIDQFANRNYRRKYSSCCSFRY